MKSATRAGSVLFSNLRLGPEVLLVWVALGGCSGKSAEKCQEGLKVARQASQAEDFELARKWRQYAYTSCEDSAELGALDKEIVARESEAQARAKALAQVKSETAGLVGILKQFVATNKATIDRASSTILCEEPAAAAAKDERWCSATRAAGGQYTLQFRYWDQARDALQVVVTPPGPVSCAELGPHTVVASWQVPAVDGRSVARTHCSFTGGELMGLDALVSAASNAPVTVFSKAYLERDARLKAIATPK